VDWQTVGVVLVVLAAVAFLARRVAGPGRRSKPAETFVPLDRLRKRDNGCH
jgi:hypothetical protein